MRRHNFIQKTLNCHGIKATTLNYYLLSSFLVSVILDQSSLDLMSSDKSDVSMIRFNGKNYSA